MYKHHLSVILACSCGLSCLTKFSSPRSEGNLAAVSASALDRGSIIDPHFDPPWHANAIVCEMKIIKLLQFTNILYYFSWSLWYPHLQPLPGILPGILPGLKNYKMEGATLATFPKLQKFQKWRKSADFQLPKKTVSMCQTIKLGIHSTQY